jgi:threonine dehydrogenase-like Zn-dependent dehydrogenase
MKGVYIMGDRSVEVRELPKPEPQHGQVLVRATVVGICGSDLHLYRRESQPETKRFVQGHELTGVVEAVGPGVETVKEGDRVVAYQAWGCGHCALCASGHANLCSNRKIIGKSNRYQKDYSVITEAMCLPLPDEMSFDDGVMLSCAGGTSWAALDKVKPCCDDTVVVFGLGPVGLMGVMWARSMGAFVIGVETIERRLDLGKRMGAHIVIDARKENPVQNVMELTGSGATIGFESSGNKKAQSDVLAATHWSARVVYVAIGAEGAVIDPRVGRGGQLGVRTVYGTYTYSLADWYRMSRAIVLHGLKPGAIVTHRFSLEKASEAYAVADRGDCGKVVFSWDNFESS